MALAPAIAQPSSALAAAGPAAAIRSASAPPGVDPLDADPLAEGTALVPSHPVVAPRVTVPGRALRGSTTAVPAGPVADGTYNKRGYQPQTVGQADVQYGSRTALVPLPDTGTHDATGVRMYSLGGRLYDHPVAQAQFGLTLLANYRTTGNAAYLTLALKQAQRLVDRRTDVSGAWFYPYPFDFALHGNPALVLRAPWYSGMAQALALSLFSRLAIVTGNPAWRTGADATFDSLLVPAADSTPWVTHIDAGGYLWVDEYPERPAPRADLTYNGQMFGVFGLFDFLRNFSTTGDPRVPTALAMLDGTETTTRQYAPPIRTPSFVSKYCLQDGTLSATYHQIHIAQLTQTYSYTHDTGFARYADAFGLDYPAPAVNGTIHFTAGTYQLARFDASTGQQINSTTVTFGATYAPTLARQRIKGSGIWLRIDAGKYTAWWVREVVSRVWLGGTWAPISYTPTRMLHINGTVTAYRYDTQGNTIATKRSTFINSSAPFDQTADTNGLYGRRVTAGYFAGYWLPLGTAVTVD